ncbi:nitronate monooxygenase family protein [Antrihabitans sp. YC2-6]|uniref:NAD(P)H-dependent flavin oxidoreductase n=1 Tax=Antrihabitans sp. YC2-6 TaxID=2799498 RepID=UPI0018F67F64|nr:nitronate monooxygenase [Antrihabitans sp. YC2-6]MBJ8346837.1 nitronate monooxygenase [Antrihabitans sp. YC2-6]
MIQTWLTRELGLEVPIIGAPMGGRAGGELAGQVSKAGGLGMLGAARYTDPEWVAKEAAVAREVGGGTFGIGLQTWSLAEDSSILDAAIAEKPTVIALSFGDPARYVDRVRAAGITTMSQINTIDDLVLAEQAGIELIVAQGGEAGGHTGRIGTLPLLQEVLESTDLPVLAAGGISTGRGLAAVIAAGGEGVLVGTILLASPETIGPDYARSKILEASSADTVYTPVFDQARHQPWPSRWFGRALVNDFTKKYDGTGAPVDEIVESYDPSDASVGVVYAGQAAGMVRGTHPAGEIVRSIAAQAETLLGRF